MNNFYDVDIKKLNINIGYEDIQKMPNGIQKAVQYAIYGLTIDGEHHKQWYLERVLESLGVKLTDLNECLSKLNDDEGNDQWKEGIAP